MWNRLRFLSNRYVGGTFAPDFIRISTKSWGFFRGLRSMNGCRGNVKNGYGTDDILGVGKSCRDRFFGLFLNISKQMWRKKIYTQIVCAQEMRSILSGLHSANSSCGPIYTVFFLIRRPPFQIINMSRFTWTQAWGIMLETEPSIRRTEFFIWKMVWIYQLVSFRHLYIYTKVVSSDDLIRKDWNCLSYK